MSASCASWATRGCRRDEAGSGKRPHRAPKHGLPGPRDPAHPRSSPGRRPADDPRDGAPSRRRGHRAAPDPLADCFRPPVPPRGRTGAAGAAGRNARGRGKPGGVRAAGAGRGNRTSRSVRSSSPSKRRLARSAPGPSAMRKRSSACYLRGARSGGDEGMAPSGGTVVISRSHRKSATWPRQRKVLAEIPFAALRIVCAVAVSRGNEDTTRQELHLRLPTNFCRLVDSDGTANRTPTMGC